MGVMRRRHIIENSSAHRHSKMSKSSEKRPAQLDSKFSKWTVSPISPLSPFCLFCPLASKNRPAQRVSKMSKFPVLFLSFIKNPRYRILKFMNL